MGVGHVVSPGSAVRATVEIPVEGVPAGESTGLHRESCSLVSNLPHSKTQEIHQGSLKLPDHTLSWC